MKNSKKIMMTMALGLSLGALGFGVSANLDSNVAYAEEDQIELWFKLLRKIGDKKDYSHITVQVMFISMMCHIDSLMQK